MPPDESMTQVGTAVYKPKNPETRSIQSAMFDPTEFEEITRFPFLPNTGVAILQSPVGFHGMMEPMDDWRRSYLFSVNLAPPVHEALYGDVPIIERAPYLSES